MKRRGKVNIRQMAAGAVFGLPVLAGVFPEGALAVPGSGEIHEIISTRSYGYPADVLERLSPENIDSMDEQELNTVLTSGDRYASYISAASFRKKLTAPSTGAAGVGMDIIRDREGRVRCIPFPRSPADEAGIYYGDILLAVDGYDITGSTLDETAARIRGVKDTAVTLTVLNSFGGTEDLEMSRDIRNYPEVVKTGKNPVIIKIFRFSPDTEKLLRREIVDLVADSLIDDIGDTDEPDKTDNGGAVKTAGREKKSGHEKRVFIDLRGNTGGMLEQGALSAALMLPKDAVLYRIKDRRGIRDIRNKKDGVSTSLKLIVMQDHLTASAAEMMTVALKNGTGARTYGELSAGKSRVQEVFRLKDGSYLKITVGELINPEDNTPWEGKGLEPDATTKFRDEAGTGENKEKDADDE